MNMTGEKYFDWIQVASEADHELGERVFSFEEHFNDMLFREDSITNQFISCQHLNKDKEWEDGVVDLPEELEYFSYSFFTYYVKPCKPGIGGLFNSLDQELIIAPEFANNYSVILHEMIHIHELVLKDLPLYYHDSVFWCLFKDLRKKINNIDDIINDHGHILGAA